MTPDELNALILKGQKGECNKYEQNCLAFELVTYRSMALRLEKCIHVMVKEAEKCQPIDQWRSGLKSASMSWSRKRKNASSSSIRPL